VLYLMSVFFAHFFKLLLRVFWKAILSLIEVISTHLNLEGDDISFMPMFDMRAIVSLSNSIDGIWVRSVLHSEYLFLSNTTLLL